MLRSVRLRSKGGADASLLHERQEVPVCPLFDNFAIFDAEDGGSGDCSVLVGGSHTEELAFVRSGDDPVMYYLVSLGDGVVDFEVKIWKTAAAVLNVTAETFGSGCLVGKYRVVEAAVSFDQF